MNAHDKNANCAPHWVWPLVTGPKWGPMWPNTVQSCIASLPLFVDPSDRSWLHAWTFEVWMFDANIRAWMFDAQMCQEAIRRGKA